MPLSEGTPPPLPVTARIIPQPLTEETCPKNFAELSKWLATAQVNFDFAKFLFACTSGTFDSATVEDRALPRFMFDANGRFLGMFIWIPEFGDWCIGAAVGELRHVNRSMTDINDDKESKGFRAGWYVCDGTNGTPDLTANDGFFTGSAPNWDIYTVIFFGV